MNGCRYRIQRKEQCATSNILGNHSMPVHTYNWRDIFASDSREALVQILNNQNESTEYRIIDTMEAIGGNG